LIKEFRFETAISDAHRAPAMFCPLTIFASLFQQPPANPAVAAAVTVLGKPPPSPFSRLDPALQAVAPHLSDAQRAAWVATLAEPLRKGGLTAPRSVAAFLGQCAVESAGFHSMEEDLSYSAARLCQVWPTRFPNAKAAETCALRPEILANRVYANRMGNGDEASGDGWRFRGRGLIQITGRSAYERFAQAINLPLDHAVEHAATQTGSVDSAVWFWASHQLTPLANAWALDTITRKINGGTDGAAERSRLCEAALHAIGA
jgi:putative chitinase